MATDIDQIKFELLRSYQRDKKLDIASWIARFPEYHEELLDFWLWARDTSHDRSPDPSGAPANVQWIAEAALERACLAVSLGGEWLRPLVPEAEGRRIADEIDKLRRRQPMGTARASRSFKRAVVWAWVVRELSGTRARVSRLALQKASYLLESGLTLRLFDQYQQKPLGPYDHTARYKDAEPIAAKKGWVSISPSGFAIGDQIHEIDRYAHRYLRSVDLAQTLVRLFGKLSDDQLETWATTHWVAQSLTQKGTTPSSSAVLTALGRDESWSDKLRKPNFQEPQVRSALEALQRVGLLPPA